MEYFADEAYRNFFANRNLLEQFKVNTKLNEADADSFYPLSLADYPIMEI